VKKPVGSGLRGGNKRKLSASDDELAPLWEDLAASIRKAVKPGGPGCQKDKHMVPVYRVVRRDGEDWHD
jgi:hypothetical protein